MPQVPSIEAKKPPRNRGASKLSRSRVTNGKRLFLDAEIDQRTGIARRFRDLVEMHTADLGGPGGLSEAQAQLIRRVSMLEVRLEEAEGRMVAGDPAVDLEEFARISSHLRRLWEALGVRRVAKDVTPTLSDIIAAHQRDAAKKPASAPKPPEAPPVTGETLSRMQDASPPQHDAFVEGEAAE
jgi:hypothetical protein